MEPGVIDVEMRIAMPIGKRIVYVGPAGTAIIGWCPPDQELPVTLPLEDQQAFEILGRTVTFISLVRVTERAAYYKEPMVPRSYMSMHPAQR